MRLVLLALALRIGTPASVLAQAPDYRSFWPLTPGNTWVYDVHVSSGSNQGGTSSGVTGGMWTVLDSVTVATGRLPRVQIMGSGGAFECLVRVAVTSSRTIFYLLDATGDAPCDVGSPLLYDSTLGYVPGVALGEQPEILRDVVIGGMSYGSVRTAEWTLYQGTSQSETIHSGVAAESIGLLEIGYYDYAGFGGYFSSSGSILRRAEVDGQTYGAPIVPQPEFWPLAVGNRWEYELTLEGVGNRGAVAWTVVPDGDSLAMRLEHVENGVVAASVTCPVTVLLPSLASWRTRFRLDCTLPAPMLAPNLHTLVGFEVDAFEPDTTLTVGPQVLTVDLAAGMYLHAWSNGNVLRTTWRAARGVGVAEYVVRRNVEQWTARLGYALVDGVTYGEQVIAVDDAPSTARLRLVAGPNPTAGSLTVRFVLPSPSEARLTVVDALGREVRGLGLGARPAGPDTEVIALDGVAPGVYTVRLAAGEAVATARVSVVR